MFPQYTIEIVAIFCPCHEIIIAVP